MAEKSKHGKLGISTIVLLIICAVMFLAFVCGIRPCSVISGSMEPNLPTWSLCFVNTKASYDEIKTGDIVVYVRHSDQKRIIHRVVEIESDGMVTKGDANPISDGLSVDRNNLYGKYLFHIPYLGYLSKFTEKPIVKILLAVFVVVLLTANVILGFKPDPEDEKDEEQASP